MKKKYLELLQYLCEHENPITSKQLANVLHVSNRSIKNYVNALNLLANDRMIISSNTGYTIHKKMARKLIAADKEQLPQTSEERSFFIVKQLLIDHMKKIDIFDLCDTLFVSYSTIKSDIGKMNKAFSNFHVEFVCENDNVRILGSERNKRKLVSYVIYEETNSNFMNTDILADSFKAIPINQISSIIVSTFKKYNYYINDFAYINLLLHFAIIIDRLKEGNYVNATNEDFHIENPNERSLVYELCHLFEDEFQITFNKNEQFEIYMLFKTNANYSIPSSQDTLKKMVGEEIITLTNQIVDKVNDYYYIYLGNENFVTPFTLHLKNLILRAQNGTYTKNPMTQSIKTSCPTVYDIAIYIALELMKQYNIEIQEDEITFLALHIGAEIERQKTNHDKIKCILLCPDYMEMNTKLYNSILIEFGNQIDLVKTVSSEDELVNYCFYLCITTVKIQQAVEAEVIEISPFLQQHDKNLIHEGLQKVLTNRKNWFLKNNFHQFFSKDLFIANPQEQTKNEIIHTLANKMSQRKYVDETFEDKVHIREDAASTAFGNIAIPHSMKMEAYQTCISVAISRTGIKWSNQTIHIVMLVAINKADKRIFHELYEALVDLFSNDRVIQSIKECQTFTDFENVIYENIEANSA